jgi:hypothetical protein
MGWWEEQAIRDLHHAETILRFVVDKCNAGLADLFGDVLCKLLKYAPKPCLLFASSGSHYAAPDQKQQAARSKPGSLVRTGQLLGPGGTGQVSSRKACGKTLTGQAGMRTQSADGAIRATDGYGRVQNAQLHHLHLRRRR